MSKGLEALCAWKGIQHTFSDTQQHESNGFVESKIGQLERAVRAVLLESDVPAFLWPEAFMHVCHVQNPTPSSALARDQRTRMGEALKKR